MVWSITNLTFTFKEPGRLHGYTYYGLEFWYWTSDVKEQSLFNVTIDKINAIP
jgi:hypothetical protein